jgi:hypothetical protein
MAAFAGHDNYRLEHTTYAPPRNDISRSAQCGIPNNLY